MNYDKCIITHAVLCVEDDIEVVQFINPHLVILVCGVVMNWLILGFLVSLACGPSLPLLVAFVFILLLLFSRLLFV